MPKKPHWGEKVSNIWTTTIFQQILNPQLVLDISKFTKFGQIKPLCFAQLTFLAVSQWPASSKISLFVFSSICLKGFLRILNLFRALMAWPAWAWTYWPLWYSSLFVLVFLAKSDWLNISWKFRISCYGIGFWIWWTRDLFINQLQISLYWVHSTVLRDFSKITGV